jgi:hypothetical protein
MRNFVLQNIKITISDKTKKRFLDNEKISKNCSREKPKSHEYVNEIMLSPPEQELIRN